MLDVSPTGRGALRRCNVPGERMELLGDKELSAKMTELGVKADEIAHKAAVKWGDAVAQGAQDRAPVNTGKLRDHIKASADGGSAEVTSDAVNEHGHSYAQYVELGTGHGGAQPYLYPAFAEHRDVTPYVREALVEKGIT